MSSSYYHQQYDGRAAPEQVVIQTKAPQRDFMHESKPSWSWCSTGWSIFAIFCCSPFFLCGMLGLVLSTNSYADHKSSDFERSRYKRNCAWGCAMTAIILGLMVILAVLLIVFVSPWRDNITEWFESWSTVG